MSHRFGAMVERIATFNRFDSSTITKAFEDEVRMNLGAQGAFRKKVQKLWNKFTQNKSNIGNYSNFFRVDWYRISPAFPPKDGSAWMFVGCFR